MTVPLHLHASFPVDAPAEELAARLAAAGPPVIAHATADASLALRPLFHRWGITVETTPTAAARLLGDDELGRCEVVWHGDEAVTCWPALAGRILVVPDDRPGTSRLALLTHRSPHVELVTGRVDRLHRRRAGQVATQRFLRDLARHLVGDRPADAVHGGGVAQRVADDPGPWHLHHLHAVPGRPDDLRRDVRAAPLAVLERATGGAIARARDALAQGRFRAPPSPRVAARPTGPGELGIVAASWRGDEDATGWPQLDLRLVVEVGADGTRLAVLASRPPGYDVGGNRVDRFVRDRILRGLGADLAELVADELRRSPAGAEVTSTLGLTDPVPDPRREVA